VDVVDAVHRALELTLERRYDDAIEILLGAAKDHEDEDLYFAIAHQYTTRGLLRSGARAKADFEEADKWAEIPYTRAARAAAEARGGDLARAEAMAAEALEMDPELAMGYVARGVVRMVQGRLGEAIEALAKAVDLKPGTGDAHALLAEALAAAGKADFAAKALEEGLKHYPEDDRLLVAASRSYVATEDFERARRALEVATQTNFENADAWRGLAWIAAKNGEDERMRQALERAVEVDREGTLAWIAKEKLTLPELNAFGK
jgi:tetratricopeptide (TPR) repeat protein